MKTTTRLFLLCLVTLSFTNCISNKKLAVIQEDHNKALDKCMVQLADYKQKYEATSAQKDNCLAQLATAEKALSLREEQIADLKEQRDKQLEQVGGLTVLSQAANDNIKQSLEQLAQKDKYIGILQAAKNKADSINLALAINLQGVLKEGIADQDVDIKVDKTVVMINLSDKMLFKSGSADLTTKANEVLGKIAKIIESRPDFEVMVEGYTDSDPISNSCIADNWDLSVKRSTSVVRVLTKTYKIDPNRMIAAGRGQYNALASNATAEGKATNRRTRIIIMPKLDQFYDLLDPDKAAVKLN
jgi:chemotaxis protein MotB